MLALISRELAEGTLAMADMAAIAMRLHSYHPAQFTACLSQIKYLQRQGVALRPPSGRGKAASYTMAEVRRTMFALEMSRAGLSPLQIVPLLDRYMAAADTAIRTRAKVRMGIPITGERAVMVEIDCAPIGEAIDTYLNQITGRVA